MMPLLSLLWPLSQGQEGAAEGVKAGAEEMEAEGEEDGELSPEFTPACLLHFEFEEGEDVGASVTFGTVKDSFGGRGGGVGFVDYSKVGRCFHVIGGYRLVPLFTCVHLGHQGRLRCLPWRREAAGKGMPFCWHPPPRVQAGNPLRECVL